MHQPHRLKSYLLAFALVLTVPLLVGTGIAVWRFSESERLHLMSMATDAGQVIGMRVDREISTRVSILQGLAATPSIYDDLPLFSEQARSIAASTGVHIVLFDSSGQQLVNTRSSSDLNLPMTADPDLIRDVVERPTMIYVANLFLGKVSQTEHVQVAVPVMRDGKVYRILGATILSAHFVSLVSEDLKGPLYAALLDRNGVVIARSPEPENSLGEAPARLAGRFPEDEGTVWLDGPAGEPLFAYYRRLPTSGWLVIAAISKAALDGPLFRSIEILGAFIAGLVAIACGSAWLIARRLTLAHRSLIDAAAALGDGRVPASHVTALHEVNLAAAALSAASQSVNRHAEQLTDANQNLERRVRQRTEELRLQTAVIETKTALFETTLDTMNQGLMVIDADGRVPICNRQARRLLDLPEALFDRHPPFEEIAGLSLDRAMPGADADAGEAIRLPHPERSAPRFEHLAPNGRILEIRTAPIQRGGGFVQTFADVTEERHNRRLLEEARIAAENANLAKSDFLATMSHEMRTPLNAIIGYSDILLGKAELEADIGRSLKRIRDAGVALLGLTNDVLDLGKIEAGVIDIHVGPFALADVIDQVLAIIRQLAEAKGLAVEVRSSVALEGLRLGDRDRLRQVLLNLLGNAVKFTISGGVELSIGEGPRGLRFDVADTGIGIADAVSGKLFQRFQQLDTSVNRRFEGAGLGLAISKRLVERMGGRIGFRSVAGQGSVFWFDLPLAHWQADERKAQGAFPIEGAPRRILIAEDVVVNQDLAREFLESAGYDVDVVSTGRAAIDAVLADRYDLVLMDVSMPEMDGLTATRHIRRGPSVINGTPIIACTAHVLPNQVEAMKEAGVDAYLFKPLQRDELYGTIRRMLDRDAGNSPVDRDGEASGSVSALVSLLGPAAVRSALAAFLRDLTALAAEDPPAGWSDAELGDRAHVLIATASMLQMTDLVAGCRVLEDACRRGLGMEAAWRQWRSVVKDALKDVEELRITLEASSKTGNIQIQKTECIR